MIRKVFFFLLRYSSLPWLIRNLIQRNKATIIYYHDIEAVLFEKHIKVLSRRYNIISLEDYLENRSSKKKQLIITLDDGHVRNYNLLPILKKHAVPTTIFLVSGVVGTNRKFWFDIKGLDEELKEKLKKLPDEERLKILMERFGFHDQKEYEDRVALSLTEIDDMKSHFSFQSHTITHPCLDQCSDEKSLEEILGSKNQLEKILGNKVLSMAFPNGDFSDREFVFAKDAGYKCILSTEFGYNDTFNKSNYLLKRISAGDFSSPNEIIIRVSGIYALVKKYLQNLQIIK